jgi:TorA maturation chaperone TorD
VLFGDSTLALREWMRANGIGHATQGQEPEDHFGTLLLLAAWLCESAQEEAFSQLLAWHLLPWSGRFLEVFIAGAEHPFYHSLGQLAQATLAEWQRQLPMPSPTNRFIAKRTAMPGELAWRLFSDNVTQTDF